jgi:hypothetical protein
MMSFLFQFYDLFKGIRLPISPLSDLNGYPDRRNSQHNNNKTDKYDVTQDRSPDIISRSGQGGISQGIDYFISVTFLQVDHSFARKYTKRCEWIINPLWA